jgi:hypothetical protein
VGGVGGGGVGGVGGGEQEAEFYSVFYIFNEFYSK